MTNRTKFESDFDRRFRRANYIIKGGGLLIVLLIAASIVWMVVTPKQELARYQCAQALNPEECYRMLTGHHSEDPATPQTRPE